MHRLVPLALAAVLPLSICGQAAAQKIVGIGTNQTAIGQMGAAVASVVSQKGELQMRPQVVAATEQYVPMVNAYRLEFGIANSMQTLMSVRGEGLSQGRPNANLRIVAILSDNHLAPLVARDGDVKVPAQLRGKRAPSGWTAQEVGRYLTSGFIYNGGLTWNDVTQVPVAGFPQQFQALQEGRIDLATAIIGQGIVAEVDSRMPVRFVSLDATPAAVKRMQEQVPGSYITRVEPRPGLVGVLEPINAMTLDYVLFTNDKVDEQAVYAVVKALYEAEEELRKAGPLWRAYSAKRIAKAFDADYHPGAIRFYREKNMWPPK